MRKSFCLLLLCSILWTSTYSQGGYCKRSPKVSFSGKAPWAIDGKLKDWTTLFGPFTGNNDVPFQPPVSSTFNVSFDRTLFTDVPGWTDPEHPQPDADMRFLAFTHDDYNVYYYFRRRANGSSINSFYYFFDVNGDATMNIGEPVVHAAFTNKSISPLTLGLYVPDKDTLYSSEKQGNVMNDRSPFGVNGMPLPGTVVDVFNSQLAIFPITLKRNEIFKATLTEDGYGLELAIPWRYLRNWLTLKNAMNPGDIFFYEVAVQEGSGHYDSKKVVDNAGSCTGGVAISGNVALDKKLTTTALVPGSKYRFKLEYTNLTNAATEMGLEEIKLHFTPTPGLSVLPPDFAVAVSVDKNCNGTLDNGEESENFGGSGSSYACCGYFPYTRAGLGFPGPVIILPPFGKGCYLVDVTLPANGAVTKFKISFEMSALFVEGRELCDPGCGSKPINHVIEGDVNFEEAATDAQQPNLLQRSQAISEVLIYPNPSRGITNLSLPQSADITVIDNLGRSVQTIRHAKPGVIQLKNLRPGFYNVRIKNVETGKVITRKFFVQQ